LNQTRGLDFGAGFYLTISEEQAARFSEIVLFRRKSGKATVNIYEYDIETVENILVVRRFAKADTEWLSFVAKNRLKTYTGESYDIVAGPVANDTVMPTIQAFLGGFLTEEATTITLKTSKLANQICLKTDRALLPLRFVRSYETAHRGKQ
jgi:hypothetical protein